MQKEISYVCQCGHCGEEEITFQDFDGVGSNTDDEFIESTKACSCGLCGKYFNLKIYSYSDDLIIESDVSSVVINYDSPYKVESKYLKNCSLNHEPDNKVTPEPPKKDYSSLIFYGVLASFFLGANFLQDYFDPRKFIATCFGLSFAYLVFYLAKGDSIWQTVKNILNGLKWIAAVIFCIILFGSLFNCSGSNYSTPEPTDIFFRK